MYQTEHDVLFSSIRAGKPFNDGEKAAHSSMVAILGRMVAYTGQKITYQRALNSRKTSHRRAMTGKTLEVPAPPTPGVTDLFDIQPYPMQQIVGLLLSQFWYSCQRLILFANTLNNSSPFPRIAYQVVK